MRPEPAGRAAARGAVLFMLLLSGSSATAQQAAKVRERNAAVISPDTVRVGERFWLGVTAASAHRLEFPDILMLSEHLEQLAPPSEVRDSGGVRKAAYPLVAWKAGRIEIPAIRVSVIDGLSERSLVVRPPPVEVRTVLPAESAQPRLLPPRAPPARDRVLWPWLLVLAMLGWLLSRVLRRARARSEPDEPVLEPAPSAVEEARTALLALRERAAAGDGSPAVLYDGIESVLRRYLVRTRSWPEQAPVRSAVGHSVEDRGGELDRVVRRAVPARFGALDVPFGTLLEDLDALLTWLETEAAA